MNKKLKNLITYGLSENETYIQSELYYYCKIRKITIYLEQTLNRCGRPDAIIIMNEQPIIIECKMRGQHINIYDEQFVKYSRAKLPILILEDKNLVEETLDFLLIKKRLKGFYLYNFSKKRYINYRLKEINENNHKEFKILRIL